MYVGTAANELHDNLRIKASKRFLIEWKSVREKCGSNSWMNWADIVLPTLLGTKTAIVGLVRSTKIEVAIVPTVTR